MALQQRPEPAPEDDLCKDSCAALQLDSEHKKRLRISDGFSAENRGGRRSSDFRILFSDGLSPRSPYEYVLAQQFDPPQSVQCVRQKNKEKSNCRCEPDPGIVEIQSPGLLILRTPEIEVLLML